MASTIALLPLFAALWTADTTLVEEYQAWQSVNEYQTVCLQKYNKFKDKLSCFSPTELMSCASSDCSVVNTFLCNHKFDIQLDPMPQAKNPLYVASILDVNEKWIRPGELTLIWYENNCYTAVSVDTYFEVFNLQLAQVLCMHAKNHDKVFMVKADKVRSGFDLLSFIEDLAARMQQPGVAVEHYDKVVFPMVTLNDYSDISWLGKMFKNHVTEDKRLEIAQALQQTRFTMNEIGAHVESAVAIGCEDIAMATNLEPKFFEIREPFFLWIERPGLAMPLLVAYCDETVWERAQLRSSCKGCLELGELVIDDADFSLLPT